MALTQRLAVTPWSRRATDPKLYLWSVVSDVRGPIGKLHLSDERLLYQLRGEHRFGAQQDVQAGSRAGVNATPMFLINGEFLSTVKSEADLTVVIDRQLSGLARRSSTQALR